MALAKRIIVSLLHDGSGNCVKPVAFKEPMRKVGRLKHYIKMVAERDIDELCLINICAPDYLKHGIKPNFSYLQEYAKLISCPLMVGGSIKTLDDVKSAIDNGADKILLHNEPFNFIEKCSNMIGVSSVSLNLTYSETRYIDYLDYSALPVGEIVLTNMRKDGTMQGYDLVQIKKTSNLFSGSVVANGGCGSPQHMHEALSNGADAVMSGSMFLFTDVTPKIAARFLKSKGHEVRYE